MFGKDNATIKDLTKVKLIRPEKAGKNWKGIPHAEFAATVTAVANQDSWQVAETRYHLWWENWRIVAAYKLVRRGAKPGPLGLWFAYAMSNRGDKALRFYAGVTEEATDTPLVIDRWNGGRLTLNFDPKDELSRAFQVWEDGVADSGSVIVALKARKLSNADYKDMLLRVSGKLLPWSKAGVLDKEYKANADKTLWGFHKAFSHTNFLTAAPKQLDNLYGEFEILSKQPTEV